MGGLLLLVAACASSDNESASSPASEESAEDEVKVAAKCERDFAAPLRAKVKKAREDLETATSPYAIELRNALDEGKAVALPFCQMTPEHFEHFKKDADLTAFGSTPEEQFRRLKNGETRGMKSVHEQLYGYMWDEKIYIASNMTQKGTLETLAHEVRHVLRKAHLRNFNDQRVTCVEEHEAAKAEALVHKAALTPEEDRALLDRVQELYELDKLEPGTCGYKN